MPDALNPRSRRVLRAAVAQYIETGRPVGSKALVVGGFTGGTTLTGMNGAAVGDSELFVIP